MPATQPTPDQAQAFLGRDSDAPVAMVNLLKFKDKATYEPGTPEAAENLTGREAYARYGTEVSKLLAEIGATPIFAGPSHGMMIGEGEWDMVAIVQYPSRAVMMGMGTSEAYQKIHYHREAGLDHQLLIDTTALPIAGNLPV